MCPCFLCMCFYNLTLCHGKREFLVKFQCLLISHSVFVKIHDTLQLYCLLKVSPCSLVFLSMQNYVTGKGCFMSLYFRFWIFGLSNETFPVSLGLFKICVKCGSKAPDKNFFSIYTKLYYKIRGLNDKLKHKFYKC